MVTDAPVASSGLTPFIEARTPGDQACALVVPEQTADTAMTNTVGRLGALTCNR